MLLRLLTYLKLHETRQTHHTYYPVDMGKVSETGVVRGSVAPPLVKNGGLVLPRITKLGMYIVLIEPDNFLIYTY